MCKLGVFSTVYSKNQDLVRVLRDIYGQDPVHGWPHIIRVLCIESEIIENEFGSKGVDLDTLFTATIFHDIGRVFEESLKIHHARISAEIARIYLRKSHGREKLEKITHIILAHSYSLGVKPESLEAIILSDADKLDALGAIGLYRAIVDGERRRRGLDGTISHIKGKLLRLPTMLYTEYARKTATHKISILKEFIRMIEDEQPILQDLEK